MAGADKREDGSRDDPRDRGGTAAPRRNGGIEGQFRSHGTTSSWRGRDGASGSVAIVAAAALCGMALSIVLFPFGTYALVLVGYVMWISSDALRAMPPIDWRAMKSLLILYPLTYLAITVLAFNAPQMLTAQALAFGNSFIEALLSYAIFVDGMWHKLNVYDGQFGGAVKSRYLWFSFALFISCPLMLTAWALSRCALPRRNADVPDPGAGGSDKMRKSPMQIVERDPIRWWHVLIGLIVVVLLVLQIADEFAFRDFVAPSFRRVPLFPLYPGDPGAWFGACFNAIWYFLSQHLGPLALAGMLMLIRSKAGVAS